MGAVVASIAAAVVGAVVGRPVLDAFAAPLRVASRGARRASVVAARAEVIDADQLDVDRVPQREGVKLGDDSKFWESWNLEKHGGKDFNEAQKRNLFIKSGEEREALDRMVKVTDVRDLNELLRLPNPLRPSMELRLAAITLESGDRIDRPSVDELKKLKPTKLRPIYLHWKDASQYQAKAPKAHDEFIRRLLNAGPQDCEELVRANWQQFDKGFFFRLTELRGDTTDERLKEKLKNLERLAYDIVAAGERQMRKDVPERGEDAKEILYCMLEEDQQTLLWPPPAESYKRLAETITKLATRADYDNGWFETMFEICERFGKKMQVQDKKEMFGLTQVVMQRLTTEWLRHDSLWEETNEGQFIYRLMCLSHEQWPQQLILEKDPLDTQRLRDELKIISETKVMQLPMASKTQIYAAKYLQGMVEFVTKKDEILAANK